MSETWKQVRNYEGIYEASSVGNIRRIRPASGTWCGKILAPAKTSDGRLKVVLSKRCITKNFKVHRIIADSFLGICPEGHEVNHKDGNPSNNHVSNLEYVTPQANSLHSCRVLMNHSGENNSKAKLTLLMVREILSSTEKHYVLANKYGVSISTVQDVRAGRTWRCAR